MLGTLRGVALSTAIRRPWSERHTQLSAAGGSAERYSTVVERDRERRASGDRVALGWAFAGSAATYWLSVFPFVCREIAGLRQQASAIPDPALRDLALQALQKRGNMEGAAAFATLVPRPRRRAVARALVAFQAAYNYVDMLAEQPCEDAVANGRRLHEALCVAVAPGAEPVDYYEHHPQRDDGGYLDEMVQRCRDVLSTLPSYGAVARSAQEAVERIVACQSLSLGERSRAQEELERWAVQETERSLVEEPGLAGELEWWEVAAAGGSSLVVFVLIAAAASAKVDAGEIAAIESAYFPWIGALHSLLDSVVDEGEDAEIGQLSLVGCYACAPDAAERMGWLAEQAMKSARELSGGPAHAVIVAGMAGYYLSALRRSENGAGAIRHRVAAEIGGLARPVSLVFSARGLR
jgi:tetraprenyl-beta-curcumene synthase